jgi:hypothetical protein
MGDGDRFIQGDGFVQQIVQVLPAPEGWRAVLVEEDEHGHPRFEALPIVCWALVQETDEEDGGVDTYVMPMLPNAFAPFYGKWRAKLAGENLIGVAAPGEDPGEIGRRNWEFEREMLARIHCATRPEVTH